MTTGARLRVLVTGGSGFVGRHVVAQLSGEGHRVLVADRHPYDGDQGEAVEEVLGDLQDPVVCDAAVPEGLDAVVHLAAATSVLGSVEQPAAVHQNNVEVTARLLELARVRGVSTFVLASTNAVVGDVGTRVIDETLPLAPLTPYGATKAACEMLLSGYAGSYGIRAPVVRLTNIYGPGMHHKDSFVPRLMRAAADGTQIEVFGDGQQRRDLINVHDVAQALSLAVARWPNGPTIVGGAHSYTVNEIVAAAAAATERELNLVNVPAKPGEMPAVVVDIARARSLGFEPSVDLRTGLRQTWADFAPTPSPED